ncbi:MAG: hypothetical protein CL942_14210 [Desulfovibrio sp.]|nr:hypothetical protein [Desulfovibrio sp.]|tara:strand:+ start:598 stop:1215 length:618 start_codon:yes stop_codon:yes gene_type:complete
MAKNKDNNDIKDVTLKSLSYRLEEVIEKLGVSKKDFAKAGKVTPQALSGYLKGRRSPDSETIANWVREYNINANYLLIYRGTIFRSEADNQHPADIDETTTASAAPTPMGTVTQAVASIEQAHLAMDPDATETEIMEAVLRAMDNRLRKIAPEYDSPISARGTSSRKEEDNDKRRINQDPETRRVQFGIPMDSSSDRNQSSKSNK